MIEQEMSRLLEQVKTKIAAAQKAIQSNWDLFMHAQFDLAREHIQKASQLFEAAVALEKSDISTGMSTAKLASIAALDAYCLAQPSRVAEARGTWYRPTEKSDEEVCHTLDRMQAAGLNELYVEAWFWGYTIYPSQAASAQGIEEQHPAFRGWDPLEAFVKESSKRGIAVHAWLDGFMVGVDPTGGPVLRVYPEWSAFSKELNALDVPQPEQGTGYYWLDITNAHARHYLRDIIKEIVSRYDVVGVNLDFIRFPEAAQIRTEMQPAHWEAWSDRVEKIEDEFVAELYNELKSIRPQLIVSATPEPGTESEKIGHWSHYVDVVIPQAYHRTCIEVRESVLRHKAELASGNLIYSGVYPMYIGLDAQDTVEQIFAASDQDQGTIIFAFGQATEETIRALRTGPWRNPAISTGLSPRKAVQALLQSTMDDIEHIYMPRGALAIQMGRDLRDNMESLLHNLRVQLPQEEISEPEARAAALVDWLSMVNDEAEMRSIVRKQLINTLSTIRELLIYARIKQID
ncbi:family 10 glycosylhydrolase [Paenibacillus alba]|uniref:glycoside hydrolase family 10 protein n=1 Tax=Paenibacillus alba TaxID=1197127 RepID=UPI0015644641|nr:family 10 glycosylhydrolase [Paenibacillus alba]NQX67632.1 family 10 glycosylhydrolase [Paenibacillus alba]